MNRRRLILTTLGALAGLPLAVKGASFVSVAPVLTTGRDTVFTSPRAAAAIETMLPKVSVADLFVSVGAEVSGAVSGLQPPQPWVVHIPSYAKPAVTIGPLFISGEYEVQAFLETMAEAILKARKEGRYG